MGYIVKFHFSRGSHRKCAFAESLELLEPRLLFTATADSRLLAVYDEYLAFRSQSQAEFVTSDPTIVVDNDYIDVNIDIDPGSAIENAGDWQSFLDNIAQLGSVADLYSIPDFKSYVSGSFLISSLPDLYEVVGVDNVDATDRPGPPGTYRAISPTLLRLSSAYATYLAAPDPEGPFFPDPILGASVADGNTLVKILVGGDSQDSLASVAALGLEHAVLDSHSIVGVLPITSITSLTSVVSFRGADIMRVTNNVMTVGDSLERLHILGLEHESTGPHAVTGLLPITSINDLPTLGDFRGADVVVATTYAGNVMTQGDDATGSGKPRLRNVTGSGAGIGAIFQAQRSIGSAIYYSLGLHQQQRFGDLGYRPSDLPETLAVCPELSEEQVRYVASELLAG